MSVYQEISCQSACRKLAHRFPYSWDMNLYRGCEHGCQYCYAVYSHQYLNQDDFFSHICVKTNIVEQLERQLRSPSWKQEIINIGGVTDSYQPAEAQYQLMPQILKLLIRYKTPAIILTKSDLILRDYDLIDQLSRITYIKVAATVTTVDEKIRRKLEPGGATAQKRLAMLKEFLKTNASVGLHVMPIIPTLTDSRENLESLFCSAREIDVHYLLSGTLNLRDRTKQIFYTFIQKEFPALWEKFSFLYQKGGLDKSYKDKLYQYVNALRKRYAVPGNYSKPMKEKLNQTTGEQLSLF